MYSVFNEMNQVLAHDGWKNGEFWVNGQGKEPDFVDKTDHPIRTTVELAKDWAAKLGGRVVKIS